ncbi:cyclic nucleotide-binding domain protein, partial [Vibrio parahaemolyticus SBR10290]
IF